MAYHAGQGTVLKRGAATGASLPAPASDTFTEVSLVGSIKLPADTRTVNYFKTLDSPDPRAVGGGFENRVLSFRLVWDPADSLHRSLRDDATSTTSTAARRNWKVIMPDGGEYTFDYVGFVSKWEWEDIENEKESAAAVEITIDGTPDETA